MIHKIFITLCVIAATVSSENGENFPKESTSNAFTQTRVHEDKGPPIIVIVLPPAATGDIQQNSLYTSYLETTNRLLQLIQKSPLIISSQASTPSLSASAINLPESSAQSTSTVSTPSNFPSRVSSNEVSSGSECSRDGGKGVCTELWKCSSALRDLLNRKQPQICSSNSSQENMVCCVDNITSSTESRITSTPTPSSIQTYIRSKSCNMLSPSLTSNITGQKAWNKCVEYQEKLVFPCTDKLSLYGGLKRDNRCKHNYHWDEESFNNTAETYEFPHMALVGYGNDVTKLEWLCGGSLISEKFVLTAGHCLSSRENGLPTYVALGILKRSDITANNLYMIGKTHKHPDHSPPKKYNDIALLELEKEVSLNEFLVPACLHTGNDIVINRAYATGWGSTDLQGPLSDDLKKVALTKFNSEGCAEKYPSHRLLRNGLDPNTQLCYETLNPPSDTCQGDGGGPLQVHNKDVVCMYTVIGVTSYGKGCGVKGEPGIYTKVAHYINWIEKIVWP